MPRMLSALLTILLLTGLAGCGSDQHPLSAGAVDEHRRDVVRLTRALILATANALQVPPVEWSGGFEDCSDWASQDAVALRTHATIIEVASDVPAYAEGLGAQAIGQRLARARWPTPSVADGTLTLKNDGLTGSVSVLLKDDAVSIEVVSECYPVSKELGARLLDDPVLGGRPHRAVVPGPSPVASASRSGP